MSEQLDQARAELATFFAKIAGDLIPLLVNSMIKEPPPQPPPPVECRIEDVIVVYEVPTVGSSIMILPPEGKGWGLLSLDLERGCILGHWRRVIDVEPASDTIPSAPLTEPNAVSSDDPIVTSEGS